MPHLHFARTVYKAGSVAASARLEYITGQRALQQDRGTRQIRYQKEGREDLVEEGTRNLPDWAQGNPYTYFRAAEQYERQSPNDTQRRGISFEEFKISLPRELTREANTALMYDLLDALAGDTLPVTYAFHAPRTMNDSSQQPHLHVLISGRITDGYTRTEAQHFRRFNRVHPERGGARKSAMLNHRGAVKANRIFVSDIMNLHLERDGLAVRIHPDRLRDRGMTRSPEPKLLPSESRAYRQDGVVSETMAEVLAIRAQRAEGAEQANAQAYWTQRKQDLGLTDGMDLPAQLAVLGTARALVRDQAPSRRVAESDAGVEQEDRRRGDRAGEVSTQTQEPSLLSLVADVMRLCEGEETAVSHGRLVRLFDREPERDRGRSRG